MNSESVQSFWIKLVIRVNSRSKRMRSNVQPPNHAADLANAFDATVFHIALEPQVCHRLFIPIQVLTIPGRRDCHPVKSSRSEVNVFDERAMLRWEPFEPFEDHFFLDLLLGVVVEYGILVVLLDGFDVKLCTCEGKAGISHGSATSSKIDPFLQDMIVDLVPKFS